MQLEKKEDKSENVRRVDISVWWKGVTRKRSECPTWFSCSESAVCKKAALLQHLNYSYILLCKVFEFQLQIKKSTRNNDNDFNVLY